MSSTQTVRYALMCLQALETQTGKPLSTSHISRQQGVPMEECQDVLARLARAGVVTQRAGDYLLERPLAELSALDILAALTPTPKPATAFTPMYAAARGAARKTRMAARLGEWIGVGAALLSLALFSTPAHAGYDVGTKFADVIMENVIPGKLYNLRTMRNLPYRVHNASTGEMDLIVSAEIPVADQMKPGYEPIPDPSWVRVVPNHFKLQQGEEGVVDVILQVPDDKAYIGHHYQAHILCRTADPEPGDQTALVFGVALQSRLRFSVGVPGPEEIRRLQKKGIYQMLNFTLEPDSQYVPGFLKPGKPTSLSELGVRPTLINRSPQKLQFSLKSVQMPAGMAPPTGYEAGDPTWLKVKTPVAKVDGESMKGTELEVTIPDKPEFRGKRFMLVLQGGLEGRDIPVEVFSRVYVNVEK